MINNLAVNEQLFGSDLGFMGTGDRQVRIVATIFALIEKFLPVVSFHRVVEFVIRIRILIGM